MCPTPIEQLSRGSNEQGRSPCQTMSEQQWGINTVLKQTQTPWLNPPFPRNQQFLGETQLHPHDPPRTPQAPSTEPGSSAATVSRAPYLEDKGLTRADSCGHISRNVPVSNVPPADTKNFSSEKARGGNRVPSSKEEVETRGVERREPVEHPGRPIRGTKGSYWWVSQRTGR